MTLGGFCIAAVRLAAIVAPAWVIAHVLRARLEPARGAASALAEAVLTLSVLLVGAQLLGVLSLLRFGWLVVLFVAVAVLAVVWDRRRPAEAAPSRAGGRADSERPPGGWCALAAVVVVAAQWCLGTANALGAGMLNFDTLAYHMPFAARFAETGSITGVHFTLADPIGAYYPANSELLHALGIVALHNDFASPFINLMWLAVALLAAWCVGARWGVERLTLIAGALVMSLPVMSLTQAGEARNDVPGLAMLLAAAALLAEPEEGALKLVLAGLALGIAVGVKYTFIVPAAVLVIGIALRATRGHRARALGLLAAPLALAGGYWYLRAVIDAGNPLGVRTHIGPLTLPGPVSPLANATQQTVSSELGHLSLWGSRFAPGLYHALGPLWPLVLLLYLAAVIGGLALSTDPTVRLLAIAALLAGVSYVFLPGGSTSLQQQTNLFEANLRYAAPALLLGAVLIPILGRLRAPRSLAFLGPALLLGLLVTQLEGGLWPSQTGRHLVFLVAVAAVTAAGCGARTLRSRGVAVMVPAAVSALLVAAAGAYAVQRHYFDRRYLVGGVSQPGLAAIDRWAQGVSHVRIALYGSQEQYPLYGARDTNVVDYLGVHTADGGYAPISSCTTWREVISRGDYRYVVLTPALTRAVPISWTQGDSGVTLVLHPAADAYVFKVTGQVQAPCG
jgi:hypothetical protein